MISFTEMKERRQWKWIWKSIRVHVYWWSRKISTAYIPIYIKGVINQQQSTSPSVGSNERYKVKINRLKTNDIKFSGRPVPSSRRRKN